MLELQFRPIRASMAADIGGGTVRHARIIHPSMGQIRLQAPTTEVKKFTGFGDMVDYLFAALTKRDFTDVDHLIISIAGPVDPITGVIKKITNQNGVEEKDIPLGLTLERMLSLHFKRPIKVTLINDSWAGAYAESSAQGALSDLRKGQLFLTLILGNGVGGEIYQKTDDWVVVYPGGFEAGHRPAAQSLIERLGLRYLVSGPCGCGIKGDPDIGVDPCFEQFTSGPALRRILHRESGLPELEGVDINKEMSQLLTRSIPAGSPQAWAFDIKYASFDHSILRSVYDLRGKAVPQGTDLPKVFEGIPEADRGRVAVALHVLSNEALLLQRSLAVLQAHHPDPINFVPIGGAGIGFGPWLVPLLTEAFQVAKEQGVMSSWMQLPTFRCAAYASNETNLAGNGHLAARMAVDPTLFARP